MLRFKEFIKTLKQKIPAVIFDAYPTHGAHSEIKPTKNNRINEKIELIPHNTWHKINDNSHLGKDDEEVHKKLNPKVKDIANDPNHSHAHEYTKFSSWHNRHLVDKAAGRKGFLDTPGKGPWENDMKKDEKEKHGPLKKGLDTYLNHHIDHDLHVYHGFKTTNPDEFAKKHPERKVKFPAYMSTSISKEQGLRFTRGKNTETHLLHIHLKKGDKGRYIGSYSAHPDEKEFLMPRNTTLKIRHTPDIHEHEHNGRKYTTHIWHAHVVDD